MSSTVATILQRAVDGHRLTFDEGVALLEQADLLALGRAADAVCRRLHPGPYRTYNIDRNINYTNVCTAVCDFCAFYRGPNSDEGYVLPREVLLEKVRETVERPTPLAHQTVVEGGVAEKPCEIRGLVGRQPVVQSIEIDQPVHDRPSTPPTLQPVARNQRRTRLR